MDDEAIEKVTEGMGPGDLRDLPEDVEVLPDFERAAMEAAEEALRRGK